ncbi:hypothetical protein [Chitinophaga nivalis]|uniref:Uncharacterized protein n=1 Tax=Chitinophaga nivalis TaxID=2991709 RepID=A0ABT3IRQ4_9BACT|nr:hypothetical protein [Chitinophaga nivalis]MCW3463667.1 hypothetical protein [Chitinophaga nivalis]MCW3486643.1 hypothetical protein [Chitinophaga nivalis]
MIDEVRLLQIRNLLALSNKNLEKKFFINYNSLEYHWFEIERDQFLFVFKRRLKNSEMKKETIRGLKQIISSFELSGDELISSNTISTGDSDLIIYSNINITVLFGVLEFEH